MISLWEQFRATRDKAVRSTHGHPPAALPKLRSSAALSQPADGRQLRSWKEKTRKQQAEDLLLPSQTSPPAGAKQRVSAHKRYANCCYRKKKIKSFTINTLRKEGKWDGSQQTRVLLQAPPWTSCVTFSKSPDAKLSPTCCAEKPQDSKDFKQAFKLYQ